MTIDPVLGTETIDYIKATLIERDSNITLRLRKRVNDVVALTSQRNQDDSIIVE